MQDTLRIRRVRDIECQELAPVCTLPSCTVRTVIGILLPGRSKSSNKSSTWFSIETTLYMESGRVGNVVTRLMCAVKLSTILMRAGKLGNLLLCAGKLSPILMRAGKLGNLLLCAGKLSTILLRAGRPSNLLLHAGKQSTI
jgi:hypothetical protein